MQFLSERQNPPQLDTTPARRRRGSALLVAMGFVLIAGFLLSTMVLTSTQLWRNAARKQITDTSLLGAQNALQAMTNNVMYIANNRPPQLNGAITAINQFVEATKAPQAPGYTVRSSYVKPWNNAANNWAWSPITDPADYWYGYTTSRLDYEVVAVVLDNNVTSLNIAHPGVALRKRITIDYIPVWSYWALTGGNTGPFELHPGPNMTVRGRMHSNNDIRYGPDSSLFIFGEITSVGRFLWGAGEDEISSAAAGSAAPSSQANTGNHNLLIASLAQLALEAATPGSVSSTSLFNYKGAAGAPRQWTMAGGSTAPMNMLDSRDPEWVTRNNAATGGAVKDASYGVRDINAPLPDNAQSIDMIKRANVGDSAALAAIKFENNADLKVLTSYNFTTPANSTFQFKDALGNTLPTTYTKLVSGVPTVFNVVSISQFWDNREAKLVTSTDIDMGRLKEWQTLATDSGGSLLNFQFTKGVVYAASSSTDPTGKMGAVRLTNATEVPSAPGNKGLSVASDSAVYTAGNVNTVNKKVFLIAADAVTVMSKKLSLTELAGSSTAPPSAIATITNMVLMIGNVPTIAGNVNNLGSYVGSGSPAASRISGGLHNSMRYLENWGSVTHTFTGSIIELFASEKATGPMGRANVYSPPVRAYNWDSSLRTSEPPPGMPAFIYVTVGNWERLNPDTAVASAP